MPTRNRVLVIGLDGGTWDLMEPWMAEGGLPNLKRLRDGGVSGRLASTIHPVTTPAWTSFLTGQQQGRHGIYDHVHRRPGTYKLDLTNASMIKSPTIFDHLGRHGLRSVSLNVPYTFPPRPISGAMVSGLFATVTGPEITYPPELFAEIARVAPGYVVHPDFDPQAPDPLQRYLDDYLTSVENQTIIAANGSGIPVVAGAEVGLTDANMLQVQETFAAAPYFQLYYDQFLPPATGSVLNDAVQGLFAGTLTPEEVAQQIEDSFAAEQ